MQAVGIPVLKLSDFYNSARKEQFVNELGKAYREIGFVAIDDHNISKAEIERLYQAVQAFFSLDEKVKSKYEIENGGGQRGYTSFGKEHAKNKSEGDLKEFYHFGQEINPDHEDYGKYPANVLCEEIPAFNKECLAIYRQLEKLGASLLKAIALYLGLEEDYFDKYIFHGNSILRPIHYPPITSAPKGALRAAEHEDINLITLLIGSSADGLQVLNKAGVWIDVKSKNEMIVVNVGDMLQRLTNGLLSSTTHRVVNPTQEKWDQPRYSIPFFLHPRPEMPLNCLHNCIDDENPKQWPDILAGDYLIQRLKEIGLLN